MSINKLYIKKANNLVYKLTQHIKNDPQFICENYGQKEIRKFIDNMESLNGLTYQEKCNIKNILYQVSEIC